MLILNNCSITYLPNLSNLQKLWCLDLPNNRLSHLDGISELGTLDLTSNFFTEIPIMKKHEKLWYLVMNHNPLKDAVPILSYKNLEGIYLSNTTLTSIPPAIGKLQGLKYLHLSDNKISHLPNKIFDLPLLAEFDISKNLLSPDDIQSIREAFAKSHPTIQLQV
jgi:Leucine-rich repeat (LRR) protein